MHHIDTKSVASTNKTAPSMPLSMARPGEAVALVDVRGGVGLRRRLAEMGLGPGSHCTVETTGRPGPVVIRVKGSRLILGYGMAHRLFVRPVQP